MKYSLLFIIFSFLGQASIASEFRINTDFNLPLLFFAGAQSETDEAEITYFHPASHGNKYEVEFRQGKHGGFVFGLGKQNRHDDFYFNFNGQSTDYRIEIDLNFVKLGYWMSTPDDLYRIIGFISYAYGDAEVYSDEQNNAVETIKASNTEIGIKMVRVYNLGSIDFDLYAGGSLYLFNYKSDFIDNRKFNSRSGNILIHIGIGLGF